MSSALLPTVDPGCLELLYSRANALVDWCAHALAHVVAKRRLKETMGESILAIKSLNQVYDELYELDYQYQELLISGYEDEISFYNRIKEQLIKWCSNGKLALELIESIEKFGYNDECLEKYKQNLACAKDYVGLNR